MTTPRSTKIMSDKFGISQPDTDVRALLINPAKWAESLAYIDTIVERDTSTPLLPAFHMYMVLNETYKAFAFSAAKRVVAHNTHYAVSLDHMENGQASEAFCGKLRCNSKGTEFAIYDDSNDPYGLKTGKPRRELGIISYANEHSGPSPCHRPLVPRVTPTSLGYASHFPIIPRCHVAGTRRSSSGRRSSSWSCRARARMGRAPSSARASQRRA